MAAGDGLIRWFAEIGLDDAPLVGGKNAPLGAMYRELAPHGVKVPSGFAVTARGMTDYDPDPTWTAVE
jgi:pyruvate,water dikinase